MNRRAISLVGFTLSAVVLATAALAWAGKTVMFRGAVVSANIADINGTPYVPLSDMARALGGKVEKRGEGYEIVAKTSGTVVPGGSNQAEGTEGKVGDMLFNGYWRFQVKSVERASEYTYRFDPGAPTKKPDGDKDDLVIITCLIKNGQPSTDEPVLTRFGTGGQKTALTDDQGQSYEPVYWDVRGGAMVQGSAKTFAIAFSVPKDAHLKALIFSLYGYGKSSSHHSEVRVTLSP
jgi:hypothetical protein